MEAIETIEETHHIQRASRLSTTSQRLASGTRIVDHFLKGGLPIGGICEWGIPPGYAERDLLLRFVTAARAMTLWIYHPSLTIYPPAWTTRGIDLSLLRFVSGSEPLSTLKPVFLTDVFKIVVLDMPEKLQPADCAFLAHRARLQQQTIIIVRNYRLSVKRGNIWASTRLNCERLPQGEVELTGLRGTLPGRCRL